MAELEYLLCQLQKIGLLLQYFEHLEQPCQFYQLLNPIYLGDPYHLIHVVSRTIDLGEHNLERKDGHDIQEKHSSPNVIGCDHFPFLNQLELTVIVRRLKHHQDVYEKDDIKE